MTGSWFHLNLSLMTPGQLNSSWRLADHNPVAHLDIGYFTDLTRIAEEAGVDAVFLGDSPSLRGDIASGPGSGLDPVVLLGHLAALTTTLGVIATVSTTYNSPYNLARRFQSLDHVTRGRIAVNLVTTQDSGAAANYGAVAHPHRAERYRRAAEFLDVVTGLWDGWDRDWLIGAAETGKYADPEKVHRLNHHGEFFSVAGPLPIGPGPQGRPVIVQAGGSAQGHELAAKYADIVFSVARTKEEAIDVRQSLRRKALDYGRTENSVKVSLGVVVIVGTTQDDARNRAKELFATLPIAERSARVVEDLGLDPKKFGPDDPITNEDLPSEIADGTRSIGFIRATRSLVAAASEKGGSVTARELVETSAGGAGHRLVIGTAVEIADDLQEWFTAGTADGFTIMFADTAVDLERFATGVVPILRERGLLRAERSSQRSPGEVPVTLREKFGL